MRTYFPINSDKSDQKTNYGHSKHDNNKQGIQLYFGIKHISSRRIKNRNKKERQNTLFPVYHGKIGDISTHFKRTYTKNRNKKGGNENCHQNIKQRLVRQRPCQCGGTKK